MILTRICNNYKYFIRLQVDYASEAMHIRKIFSTPGVFLCLPRKRTGKKPGDH